MVYRLAIVASHVVQYQAPLYRLVAAHPEIELTVFYCSSSGAREYEDRELSVSLRWDVDLLGGYRSAFLRNVSPFRRGFGRVGLVNPGVVAALTRGRFDAVLFMLGWGSVSAWLGILTCIIRRIPFLLYGDSNALPEESSLRGRARKHILRWMFSRAAGFMYSGKLNADYYRHYGVDERRLFFMPWAIDNERFERGSALTPAERLAERTRHGIDPGKVVILYCAKLLPRKRPMDLLLAFERIVHRHDAALVFAGDGNERSELETEAARRALRDVHFLGFINQRDLPRIYGMSDIFVLPSAFEPRGAVVNEAMASGLPCVVSDRVGASGDIVKDGKNGYVFPVSDIDLLASRLDELVSKPALRRDMGRSSLAIISRWDYRNDVSGILEALQETRTGE